MAHVSHGLEIYETDFITKILAESNKVNAEKCNEKVCLNLTINKKISPKNELGLKNGFIVKANKMGEIYDWNVWEGVVGKVH